MSLRLSLVSSVLRAVCLTGFLLSGNPRSLVARPDPSAPPGPERIAILESDVAGAVERVLAADARPVVRLLSATLQGNRVSLDFSREFLEFDPGSLACEQFSRRVHRAVADALIADFSRFDVHTSIDGAPLHQLLEPADRAPPIARPSLAPPAVAGHQPHPLTARRIAVSPGHGYYLNPSNNWVLQRSVWQGIVEDFVNHDMITRVREELAAAGATVLATRNLDRAAGAGESGFPKWQEAARSHVKALGADPSIWNEPNFTHLEQDIRCRPRWANSVNAEILVSLHNNGSAVPGTGTGTETLYDTNNGFGPDSRRLADAVHNRLVATLRREYNPAWTDRRVQGFNGNYGENRLATRPSILIEVAFMDRPAPDNAALQDGAFHQLVARAIREGIQEYFDGPAGVAPFAPANLIATAAPGSIQLAWTDLATNETGFRLERRAGYATPWTPLANVGANVTAFADTTASPATIYEYRVAAFNAAGSSAQFSNEATVGLPPVAAVLAPRPTAWLSNVSLRTTLAGAQKVSVGFVVAGGTREVLVRAAGPTLAQHGLVTAMADPRLELFHGADLRGANNDWPAAFAPIATALGAFPFPAASRDAALLHPADGPFTVQAGGTTAGTILVEGYDTGSGSSSGRLINVSARSRVGTGADILIAGFTLAGAGTQRVLVRAVGPALAAFGVPAPLANPRLEVYAGSTRLAENDNWDTTLATAFAAAGAFALAPGSRDAALVLELAAGRGYTVQVSGVGSTTGEALVEVYELP
jgi:N-acetylmuramoyl-L-alanine amidase